MYADLYSHEVKEAFRKTWSKNRTFDFVEKERVTIHGKTQLETEAPHRDLLRRGGVHRA